MRALVIGLGSIGERHAEILKKLGMNVSVVTKRLDAPYPTYHKLSDAINEFDADYYVVSSETSKHFVQLKEICQRVSNKIILVEKPLFQKYSHINTNDNSIYTAYNLRFHPMIEAFKDIIDRSKNIYSCQIYVGQHLSSWRKRDYKNTYSSKKAFGGGVLRDLSHELDYARYFFGNVLKVLSNIQNTKALGIDCEDQVDLLLQFEKCKSVNISLNYLDQVSRREIKIHTDLGSFYFDLTKNELNSNGEIHTFQVERNQSYEKMHSLVLKKDTSCCQYSDGLEIVKLIDYIESQASRGNIYYEACR